MIRSLFPLLKLHPWVIVLIIILGILSSFAEGLGISLFIPLLQNVSQPGSASAIASPFLSGLTRFFDHFPPAQQLILVCASIFGCILIKVCLSYANLALFSWFNARIGHRLRCGIFNQLLEVSYRFLEVNESGTLMNTLATETWQTGRALSVLMSLIISICTILVFTFLLLLISWKLTLLAAVVMAGISFTIQWVTRSAKRLGEQALEVNKELASRMWEGFSGMKVIRAFGREKYEQDRFARASDQVRSTFFKLELMNNAVTPLSELLSVGLLLGILLIFLSQSYTNLPAFLTFVFVLYRLQPQVKQFDASRVSLMGLSSSVNDVMSLLNRDDKSYIVSGDVPFTELKDAIEFQSVDFQYHEGKLALKNLSLRIPKGKTTALVGPSGAGKSTLIGLLCRFYDVNEGEIQVDRQPLKQLRLSDWREQIAIVSQDVHMFSATVRENIAYGRLDATDDEIIAAAELAHAHDFIEQMTYGYETKVGDRGVRLSGGQRQRIALARAIIRNPKILILDEATNALDSIAENLIQEALNTLSRDRTVIVIAHRFSTIEQADQIVVLENGQIKEQGDLQELLDLNGLFARMYHLQNRSVQT